MKNWKRSLLHLKLNKALSLISLATKAGKTASGEFCTEKEVKSGNIQWVSVGTFLPGVIYITPIQKTAGLTSGFLNKSHKK